MRKRTGILISLILAATTLSSPAMAQMEGAYLRIFGGASAVQTADLRGSVNGRAEFQTGQVAGIALGANLPSRRSRMELEFTSRNAETNSASPAIGEISSKMISLNGYYALRELQKSRSLPYLGAGFAYVSELEFDAQGGSAVTNVNGIHTQNGGAALQLMIGIEIPLSDTFTVNSEFRYFHAASPDLQTSAGNALNLNYSGAEWILGGAFRF